MALPRAAARERRAGATVPAGPAVSAAGSPSVTGAGLRQVPFPGSQAPSDGLRARVEAAVEMGAVPRRPGGRPVLQW